MSANDCNATLVTSCLLKSVHDCHVSSHFDEKPVKCTHCSKCFKTIHHLRRHVRHMHVCRSAKRAADKPVCSLCGIAFHSNDELRSHEIYAHPKSSPIICHECGKSFRNHSLLSSHMRGTHLMSRDSTGQWVVKINFTCDTCKREFNSKYLYDRHLLTHSTDPSVWCETCGKGFKSTKCLSQHMYIHRTEAPFVCDECGKAYKSSSYLLGHKRIHTERRFECPLCGKVYKSKQMLSLHQRRHCSVCGELLNTHKQRTEHACTAEKLDAIPAFSADTSAVGEPSTKTEVLSSTSTEVLPMSTVHPFTADRNGTIKASSSATAIFTGQGISSSKSDVCTSTNAVPMKNQGNTENVMKIADTDFESRCSARDVSVQASQNEGAPFCSELELSRQTTTSSGAHTRRLHINNQLLKPAVIHRAVVKVTADSIGARRNFSRGGQNH